MREYRVECARWQMRSCPVCGKEFLPAPQHVYKVDIKRGDIRYVCSYHCVRAHEKEKNRRKNKHKLLKCVGAEI